MRTFDVVIQARGNCVCDKSSVVRASNCPFAEAMCMAAGTVLTTHIVGFLGLPPLITVSTENRKEKKKKKDGSLCWWATATLPRPTETSTVHQYLTRPMFPTSLLALSQRYRRRNHNNTTAATSMSYQGGNPSLRTASRPMHEALQPYSRVSVQSCVYFTGSAAAWRLTIMHL